MTALDTHTAPTCQSDTGRDDDAATAAEEVPAMKATLDRMALKDALTVAKRTVGARAALPTLAGVRVHAGADGSLSLQTTDLETFGHVDVVEPAPLVHAPGAAIVSLSELAAAVKAGPDTVTLSVEGAMMVVHGAATVTLRLFDADAWPAFPPAMFMDTTERWTTLDAPTVARVGRVAVAASTDGDRPVLTAVAFMGDGVVAATDSYRLHWTEVGGPVARLCEGAPQTRRDGAPATRLVPGRVMRDVCRLAAGSVGCRALSTGDRLAFRFDVSKGGRRAPRRLAVTWATLLLEGAFPNIALLIPRSRAGRLTVDRDRLAAAVAAVKPACERGRVANPVTVRVAPDGDGGVTVRLSGGTEADGMAHAPAVGGTFDGAMPDEWGFSPFYLLDALAAAGVDDEGRVTVDARDVLKPFVFGTDADVHALLMPVRL